MRQEEHPRKSRNAPVWVFSFYHLLSVIGKLPLFLCRTESRLNSLAHIKIHKFATKSKMLTAYEDELFEDYVERIIVFSREEVGFELKCGITLKERLVN